MTPFLSLRSLGIQQNLQGKASGLAIIFFHISAYFLC